MTHTAVLIDDMCGLDIMHTCAPQPWAASSGYSEIHAFSCIQHLLRIVIHTYVLSWYFTTNMCVGVYIRVYMDQKGPLFCVVSAAACIIFLCTVDGEVGCWILLYRLFPLFYSSSEYCCSINTWSVCWAVHIGMGALEFFEIFLHWPQRNIAHSTASTLLLVVLAFFG